MDFPFLYETFLEIIPGIPLTLQLVTITANPLA